VSVHETQVLILAPTRELALQIQKVVIAIGRYMKVKCAVCIGGRNIKRDFRALAKRVHVVVGTSGRVHSMMEMGALKPEEIKILCIDEADEMLSQRSKSETTKGMSFPLSDSNHLHFRHFTSLGAAPQGQAGYLPFRHNPGGLLTELDQGHYA